MCGNPHNGGGKCPKCENLQPPTVVQPPPSMIQNVPLHDNPFGLDENDSSEDSESDQSESEDCDDDMDLHVLGNTEISDEWLLSQILSKIDDDNLVYFTSPDDDIGYTFFNDGDLEI